MHDRHSNRTRYFDEQAITTKKYVVPMIQQTIDITQDSRILEIGCGEGGNLMPFVDMGCREVIGVDLSLPKIDNAKKFFEDHPNRANIQFIAEDIYDSTSLGLFDVIIARDTLEHIHGQERFMEYAKKFLKPGGKFFLGFPPWYNPFGGHQQMCINKYLCKMPFIHLLPRPIYKGILKAFGESEGKIEGLMEIVDTKISINRFERILKRFNYQTDKRIFYLINPNYEIKFGLKPRLLSGLISWIPFLRDFLITTNYYVVSDAASSPVTMSTPSVLHEA